MKKPLLHPLFVDLLKSTYDAEQQLVAALPTMAEAAVTEELQQGFIEHLEQTQQHVLRLEEIGQELEIELGGKECLGMTGLVDEGEEVISESREAVSGDLALIAAAQKVEHYEIAAYGTLKKLAEEMGHDEAKKKLDQTLKEESQTDEKLTKVAEKLMKEVED